MRAVPFVVLVFIALASCGPIPLERAEEECFQRARLAVQPRGTVEIGASTEGPHLGAEIEVSSDFIQGRDPSDVYNSCVFSRSGQPPSQPLYSRPDWRG
jgi:hypothetical protein